MLAILGDIHFSSSKTYFINNSENIIRWMEDWKYNTEENDLLLVGDLVASAISGGLVFEFLYRFILACRFKSIRIVKGNHDEKLKDDVYQLAYSFLKYNPKVHIYTTLTEIALQGLDILVMPFYMSSGYQKTMKERYSNLYKEKKYQKHYDLIVGHFAGPGMNFDSFESVENLEKLDADRICLGHIHQRIIPEIYIGSMYANKVNENANNRAAWLLSKDEFFEDPLPNFLEFITVKYPEDLPKTDAWIPVYTITNCGSLQAAKNRYGHIYIKSILRGLENMGGFEGDFNSEDILDIDIKEMFKEYMKKCSPPIDRRVATRCLSLIKNVTNSTEV